MNALINVNLPLLDPKPAVADLPISFTYPYCYEPHPLCLQAAKQLQRQLKRDHHFSELGFEGKMMGVLVVKNHKDEVGYLSAFSGQLPIESGYFVPPLFALNDAAAFYQQGQSETNAMTKSLATLASNPDITSLESVLYQQQSEHQADIASVRKQMIANRKRRKTQRTTEFKRGESEAYDVLLVELAKQSVADKNHLKARDDYWQNHYAETQNLLNKIYDDIAVLKQKRKQFSQALQQRLFDQYHFLNAKGQRRSLLSLFEQTVQGQPPAGAGDCAAPKLLQYAYEQQLEPLAMAEFWWGSAPKSEVRQHGHFYGACLGKCKPILTHMLDGLKVDANPLLNNPGKDQLIAVIYQDSDMVVINKPAGLLSVPGKQIKDCVYSRMRALFPDAESPLIVHRLDMLTSGLMVIALTKHSHKKLQQQFIARTIKKRYIAILDGKLTESTGLIDLPLRVDFDDRPRQLVCHDYGKAAQTRWQVIDYSAGKTRVYFYPVTGRTHQLRVHSAHSGGLNMPIVGDDLYGLKGQRLCLHAETLELTHPNTKKAMVFQTDPDF